MSNKIRSNHSLHNKAHMIWFVGATLIITILLSIPFLIKYGPLSDAKPLDPTFNSAAFYVQPEQSQMSASDGFYGYVRTINTSTASRTAGGSIEFVPSPNTNNFNPKVGAQANPKTVVWLSGLYMEEPEKVKEQVAKLAEYNVQGFIIDHKYRGIHDDIQNQGIKRLTNDEYNNRLNQMKSVINYSQNVGVTDVFYRMLYPVYVPTNPPGQLYKWNIFDETSIQKMEQSVANQAVFARTTGAKGIWFDMEPYDYAYQWKQERDPDQSFLDPNNERINLSPEAKYALYRQQYFNIGERFAKTLLQNYPEIQVNLSPGFGYDLKEPNIAYLHYPDFYAGMIKAAMDYQTQNPTATINGFNIATEASYGVKNLYSFRGIYCYEEGTCSLGLDENGNQIVSPVKVALQYFQESTQKNLWQWHLTNSSVALSQWPYINDGSYRYSLLEFQNSVLTQRGISPKYTWVYDENGQWFKDIYTCDWPAGKKLENIPWACPGLVLKSILPSKDQPQCEHAFPELPAIATQTFTVNEEGEYYIWSKLQGNASNQGAYFLMIDNNCMVKIDGGTVPNNSWKWVDYKNNTNSNKVKYNLSAGTHTIRFIGSTPNTKLESVYFTKSSSCSDMSGTLVCSERY